MTDLTPDEPPQPDEATSPAGPGPARSRRSLVLAVLALIALVAVGLILLFAGDDDDGDSDTPGGLPAAPTLPPPVSGDLTAEAEELLALLDEGDGSRYHAVYIVEGDPGVVGGETTLEVWRDGGRSRRDSHVVAEDGTADTVGIVNAEGQAISCTRIDDEDFACFEVDAPAEIEGDVVGSVRSQLTGAEVTPRDDEIDGRQVRCFGFITQDGPAEICVTEDGVVVRLASGETSLQLTELDDDVPGDIFTPPAELSEPPEPPAPPEG